MVQEVDGQGVGLLAGQAGEPVGDGLAREEQNLGEVALGGGLQVGGGVVEGPLHLRYGQHPGVLQTQVE